MQYLDLKEFEDFVKSRNLVPEKYRSYYTSWVRRFLQSEFTADELSRRGHPMNFRMRSFSLSQSSPGSS